MLNTGQRTVDVIAMQRGHIRNGEISVRQQKTGARVWVPLSRDLAEVLDVWLKTHDSLMLVPSERTGGRLTVSALRQIMRPAYAAGSLPEDCHSHGLRYTAAVRLSELGCDWETISSITGHETVSMVRKRRGARLAIKRLDER
jgi:integrase